MGTFFTYHPRAWQPPAGDLACAMPCRELMLASIMLDAFTTSPGGIRPLTRIEYDTLVAMGMLEGEHVELLQGSMIVMSAQTPRHAAVIRRLHKLLVRGLGDRADVQSRLPLALDTTCEPEPDLAVVMAEVPDDDHPAHAFLVVEVADVSLPRDRSVKATIYASSGIPEYWVVNLADNVVEVHRDCAHGVYRSITIVGRGDTVSLEMFPDVEIPIAEIL
jgi:Uma2 family endonuclease